MSKNLDESGLKSIFSEYDLFFIDIWGVVHNGIELHKNAVKVLEELSDVAVVEKDIPLEGRRMSMILNAK